MKTISKVLGMETNIFSNINWPIFMSLPGATNLALGKPAAQGSTYHELYTADKAVNGDLNDFSRTSDSDANKWWTVDLEKKYSIGKIIVHNRPFHRKILLVLATS